MEVDMHSPSFREMRVSKKRTRSPTGSPTPPERTRKRVLLESNDSPVVEEQNPFLFRPSPPIMPSTSEEWVHQAEGLSIDSPLFRSFMFEDPRSIETDVSMSIDAESHPPGDSLILQQPLQPYTYRHHSGPSPTPVDSASRQNSFHGYAQLPTPDHSPMCNQGPSILLHPATPADQHGPSDTLPDVLLSPGGSRRQAKLSMGPRAGCEKCRLGVKGHWMHVD